MTTWRRHVGSLSRSRPRLLELALPTLIAIVVLGPALGPGALFNLDLVLVGRLDTPLGFWGLGPELPRRLPLWLPLSWISAIVPATVTGKLLMVALIVLSWIGMSRLTRHMCPNVNALAAQSAAALYTLSPFVLTRIAVGHYMVTWPHAILPWVLPVLVRPGRRLGLTYLACFALGFGGHFGGSVAVTVVMLALIFGDRTRWAKALLVATAAQASWLVPGLAVTMTNSIQMASGASFPTSASGLAGLVRLSAGGGFWNDYFQVGNIGRSSAIAGLVLLTLAVMGTRLIPAGYRRPMIAAGVVGWVVAAGPALPWLGPLFVRIEGQLLGGIWREPHRMLTLHLLWLAPAAALGGQRLYEQCVAGYRTKSLAGAAIALPAAIAVALAIPGVWGIGGQLQAEQLPATWNEARAETRRSPGTVLALPWYQYFNLSISGGEYRRVLNPLPLFLGGDVLSSSDNGLQAGIQEYGDPREQSASKVIADLASGQHVGDELADLGIRWVMVLETPLSDAYDALDGDAGLRLVITGGGVDLYEVVHWSGAAVSASGQRVDVDLFGPALATLDSADAATWSRPGSSGWRRGLETVTITDDGRLDIPAARGPVWNLATVPSLLAQFAAAAAAVLIGLRIARTRGWKLVMRK